MKWALSSQVIIVGLECVTQVISTQHSTSGTLDGPSCCCPQRAACAVETNTEDLGKLGQH